MTLLDLTRPRQLASRLQGLPVAIIGAGPIGLAAAANLAERGIDFVVLEAGDRIGASVAAVGAHPALLAVEAPRRPGVAAPARRDRLAEPPADALPTGAELVEAVPRARSPRFDAIAARIRLGVDGLRRHPRGHGPHAHRRPRARRRSCCACAPPTASRGDSAPAP